MRCKGESHEQSARMPRDISWLWVTTVTNNGIMLNMSKKATSPIGRTHKEVVAEKLKTSKEYRDLHERLKPFRDIARDVILRRSELGISQRELAKRVGTSAPSISRIETGCHPTSVTTLQRLANALDLELVVGLEKKPTRKRQRQKLAA